eukprot:4668332-Prymnesium_polylepis.1
MRWVQSILCPAKKSSEDLHSDVKPNSPLRPPPRPPFARVPCAHACTQATDAGRRLLGHVGLHVAGLERIQQLRRDARRRRRDRARRARARVHLHRRAEAQRARRLGAALARHHLVVLLSPHVLRRAGCRARARWHARWHARRVPQVRNAWRGRRAAESLQARARVCWPGEGRTGGAAHVNAVILDEVQDGQPHHAHRVARRELVAIKDEE